MLKMLLVSDDESTASLRNFGYEEYTADSGDSNVAPEGNCVHWGYLGQRVVTPRNNEQEKCFTLTYKTENWMYGWALLYYDF